MGCFGHDFFLPSPKEYAMKHLAIIVPDGDGNNLSSIVGAYKIFTKANELWKRVHRKDLFNIELTGVSKKVDFYEGLFTVKPHTHISAIHKTDLIIIPSLNHHYQKSVKGNTQLAGWIKEQYKNGAEVASICTGAFLLTSTGILDGKSCSTHWSTTHDFANLFPKVKLQADKLITDENGIYNAQSDQTDQSIPRQTDHLFSWRRFEVMCPE